MLKHIRRFINWIWESRNRISSWVLILPSLWSICPFFGYAGLGQSLEGISYWCITFVIYILLFPVYWMLVWFERKVTWLRLPKGLTANKLYILLYCSTAITTCAYVMLVLAIMITVLLFILIASIYSVLILGIGKILGIS